MGQKKDTKHHIIYCKHAFHDGPKGYFPRGDLIQNLQDDDHKQLHLQLDALAVGSDHNPEQIIIPWPILDAMGIKYRNEFERRGGKSSGWKLYSRMLFYEGVIEEQIIKERRPHPALITHLISVRAQREWLMWHGYLKKQ